MAAERNVVRFVPGASTAIVGDRLVALVDGDAGVPIVQQLHALVTAQDERAEAVLNAFVTHGVASLPGLVVLIHEEHCTRAFVRGSIVLDIDEGSTTPGVFTRTDARDVLSWIEQPIGPFTQARLAVSESGITFDGNLYSASFGVLPALGVELTWVATAASQALTRSDDDVTPAANNGEAAGFVDAVVEDEQGDTPAEVDRAPDLEPGDNLATEGQEGARQASSPHEDEAHDQIPLAPPHHPSETLLGLDTYLEPPMESVPSGELSKDASQEMISPAESLSMTGNYDDLFGSTQFRSVEGAAVRPEDPDAPGDADPAPQGREQNEDAEDGAPDYDPIHDGRTLTAAQLRKLRGEQHLGGSGSTRLGATDVLAVLCLRGHPNAPHDMTCRQCGSAIEEQSPRTMPRPPLGRFVFSSGEVVTIERSTLIGRSPKVNGSLPDGQPPELVQLESPDKDISRTHLEVRVEGWQIFAIDQNSANGTVVLLPGRAEQRLRPEEPFLLTIGARVRLADEIEFTVEPLV